MIDTERVLFECRLGTQRVRVWLERHLGGIRLCSHDIGPTLEQFFGTDSLETYLEVDAAHVANLTAALRAEWTDADTPMDPIDLLAARYRGDSTATSGQESGCEARRQSPDQVQFLNKDALETCHN